MASPKYVDPKASFVDDLASNLDTPGVWLDALFIGIDVTYEMSKLPTAWMIILPI